MNEKDEPSCRKPSLLTNVAQIPGLKALIGTVCDRMRSSADRTYPTTSHGGAGKVTLAGGTQGALKLSESVAGGVPSKVSANVRATSRGSDSDDDHLLASIGSRNIYVQRDVAFTHEDVPGIPLACLKRQKQGFEDGCV